MTEGMRPRVACCTTCRRWFDVPTTGPRRPRYCGHACLDWWRRFDRRSAFTIHCWGLRCEVCDRPVYARDSMAPPGAAKRFCSRECGEFQRGIRVQLHDRSRVPWRECQDCDQWFVGLWQRSDPVCRSCSKNRRRDLNRRKNVRRRTARRDGDHYTMAEVARRDGGRCHLCSKPVDLFLSGDDNRGPTIDHLVPLGDGGADTFGNVRLAHRQCNVNRGRGGYAQLILVA